MKIFRKKPSDKIIGKRDLYFCVILIFLSTVGYTLQIWIYSRLQRTLLDEGNYLYKGYLFVTGKLIPFQEYGTWTNKMPLSFLVPGYFQELFGPGLDVGRNYAFILAVLIFLGTVILAIRLGGKWGGMITAVLLAVNPAPLKLHSLVLSQGLVSLMLVITLLLILGKNRPLWQILLGSFLAGLVPLVRINLFPFFPLVVAYIFWEHGKRKGSFALASGIVSFLGMHLLYWPGILSLWGRWIPDGLFSSVDLWKARFGNTVSLHQPNLSFTRRLMAFSQGVRFQLPMLLGVFTSLVLWPKKFLDQHQKRSSVFLLVVFSALFIAHAYAALFMDYNIHAFFAYLAFFHVVGIFLVAATWQDWNFQLNPLRKTLAGVGMIGFTLIVGYSISEQSSIFGAWFKEFLREKIINVEGSGLGTAVWAWWESVQARTGWRFVDLLTVVAIVLMIVVLILLISGLWWVYHRYFRERFSVDGKLELSHGLVVFLLLGTAFSPTNFLGGGFDYYDCSPQAIEQYHNAAWLVGEVIAPGDQVFWIGKDTQVVLLKAQGGKEFEIYPQQLNSIHSFRIGGNTDQLNKGGFWQDSQSQDWIDNSQVLLFEQQAVSGWYDETFQKLDLSSFEKVNESNNIGCTYDHRIYIYKRIDKN